MKKLAVVFVLCVLLLANVGDASPIDSVREFFAKLKFALLGGYPTEILSTQYCNDPTRACYNDRTTTTIWWSGDVVGVGAKAGYSYNRPNQYTYAFTQNRELALEWNIPFGTKPSNAEIIVLVTPTTTPAPTSTPTCNPGYTYNGAGCVPSTAPQGNQQPVKTPLQALHDLFGWLQDIFSQKVCAQVATTAQNPVTSEEKTFNTPCDVPVGWVVR